jgi:hypothetical protein
MSWITEATGDFEALYRAKVQPAVQALETRRMLLFFGAIVGGFLVLVVGVQIGGAIAQVPFLTAAAPIFFFLSLAAGVGGATYVIWRLHQGLPTQLMQTIAGALGLTYAPGNVGGFSGDAFGLAPPKGTRRVLGVVRGPGAGPAFEVTEVQDVQGLGKSLFTTYHGFVGRSSWPKPFPCTVVIKRQSLGGAAPSGLQRVGLVDSEFERRFEVYSNDQVESRVLLDPVEIERWVRLDGEIGGRLQCAFTGSQVMWSVATVNLPSGRDSWPAAYKSLNKPQWNEALARDLYAAARLGEILRPTEAWLR